MTNLDLKPPKFWHKLNEPDESSANRPTDPARLFWEVVAVLTGKSLNSSVYAQTIPIAQF